jgi:subtilisin family serine protease
MTQKIELNKFKRNIQGRTSSLGAKGSVLSESPESQTFSTHSSGRVMLTCLLLLTWMACDANQPPSQTIVRPEHLSIANPPAKPQDYAAINAQHRVLLAVFDSGVDANHPELAQNIHFTLDSSGVPVSLGKDYLGLDGWASYRLVNTTAYPFEFLSPELKEEALRSSFTQERYNRLTRERTGQALCAAETLLSVDPRLQQFIEPYRMVEAETSRFHGTHVAGLMTYDRPDFGLISYRVLPYAESQQDRADLMAGRADRFVSNFEDAVRHAEAQGVKIINLSLGGSFTKPDDNGGLNSSGEREQYERLRSVVLNQMTRIVREHSSILFVAAAGNDGGWSDNLSRVQYPCGIEAPNILCVGALNYDGSLTQFTNIPLNSIDLVFAAGSNIISTVPSDHCQVLVDLFRQIFTSSNGVSGQGVCRFDAAHPALWVRDPDGLASREGLIRSLYDSCTAPRNRFAEMSGTSMATPIISHAAADLLVANPLLTPPALIRELKARAVPTSMGSLTALKLRVPRPSWYRTFRGAPDTRGEGAVFGAQKSLKGELPSSDEGFDFWVGGDR